MSLRYVFSACLLATILVTIAIGCSSSSEEQVSSDITESKSEVKTVDNATSPTVAPAPTVRPTSAPASKSNSQTTPTVVPTTAPSPTTVPKSVPTVTKSVSAAPNTSVAGLSSGIDGSKYIGSCEGLDLENQKAKLIEIGNEMFAGSTAHDPQMLKLHNPPDARDRRRGGGIWLIIEFNGDEQQDIIAKKAMLDLIMRDALEAFYRAGCADLFEVHISARMIALGAGVIGPMTQTLAAVFKTSLKKDVASTVDWDNKENIDFNEIWKTLILHTRWRKAIQEAKGG